MREEVAIRKKEQQRHAEMLAKEEEDQQKFEALHKQLRGKEYGYDHKGQVRKAGVPCRTGKNLSRTLKYRINLGLPRTYPALRCIQCKHYVFVTCNCKLQCIKSRPQCIKLHPAGALII